MSALEVSQEQQDAVEQIAGFVAKWGMTVPAILTLESMRPLSYVGSQFMHMLTPSLMAILTVPQWEALAHLLEDRRGLDHVIAAIEQADEAR